MATAQCYLDAAAALPSGSALPAVQLQDPVYAHCLIQATLAYEGARLGNSIHIPFHIGLMISNISFGMLMYVCGLLCFVLCERESCITVARSIDFRKVRREAAYALARIYHQLGHQVWYSCWSSPVHA